MNDRNVVKERILAEFKKAPSEDAPKTMEELDQYIRDIVARQEFRGKSIEFVFDRGHVDDMPRYLKIEYQLTKEDLHGHL